MPTRPMVPTSSARPKRSKLARTKNADGLVGDASLVADIDKETFQTMFSLTSDELRSLRNTTDVTAKLLTAGSGTGASPAHALADVQAQLAEYTSRAAGIEHSIVNLTARQNELRARMALAADEAERFKQQDKEFHELEPRRDELNERLDELNNRIEALSAYRAKLQKLEEEHVQFIAERDRLREEEASLESTRQAQAHRVDAALMGLSGAEDRALRDRIDAYLDEQAKIGHRVDVAKENHAASKASYEALLESGDRREAEDRARRQRRVQVALSVVLPLVFLCAGVPVLIHGRHITSLSFTALGIGLIVFALLLAGAALVMLFRPSKADEERAERLENAHWVMLQDQKKLESCRSDQDELAEQIGAYLAGEGLSEAGGSLRRARALLDEAKDVRADATLFEQKRQACLARRSAIEDSLADVARQQERIYARIDLGPNATLVSLDAEIARRTQQRTSLLDTFEHMNRRYGELQAGTDAGKAPEGVRRAEAELPAGSDAPERERARLRPPASGQAHAGSCHRRLGIQKPAGGVPPGQPPAQDHDRRPLGEGGHDAGRQAAGHRCSEERARAGASVARHVPAAVPEPTHRSVAHGRQRGPRHSYSG